MTRASMPRFLFLWVLSSLSTALAASGLPSEPARFQAVRTHARIHLDGALDEEAWSSAPVFDSFRQSFPREGEAPSERTELRILYDEQNVYFGIRCLDSRPSEIRDHLGRRDHIPVSDRVTVAIDARHDHRSAYYFSINAAGVLGDGLYFEDTQQTDTWDAVWGGAARKHPDGWSAELAIPLHVLRLASNPTQLWGLGVRREHFRTHELSDTTLIPRNANAFVSLFGHLEGVELPGDAARRVLELTPYLATGVQLRPQYSDPSRPLPRLSSPTVDLGVDLRAALSSSLELVATVNPDFGQVEADELVVDFSSFERFFPEKRPFFTQGIDLFQPVGSSEGQGPQMLFYSRRIGLDAPILGATKLTGTIGERWNFGVLDAVVAGPADPSKEEARRNGVEFDEDQPDRRFRLHLARPLHLGLNSELPPYPAVTQNFLAAVARGQVSSALTLGTSLTAATPLSRACEPAAPPLEESPDAAECLAPSGGNAVGLDWDLRSSDSEWVVLGQLAGSRVTGGPEGGLTLRDGTLLQSGDLGLGAYVRGGKLGGEPFRFTLGYEYTSPRLELNRTGYQRTQNEQLVSGQVSWVRPSGAWGLEQLRMSLGAKGSWSTEGRGLPRGSSLSWETEVVLPGFHTLGVGAAYFSPFFDIREISQTGIAFGRPSYYQAEAWLDTDSNRPLALSASAFAGKIPSWGPNPAQPFVGGELGLTWRPQPRFETQLQLELRQDAYGPRWLETLDSERFVFSDLTDRSASLTLRQLWVVAADLTFQAYLQLLGAQGGYARSYEATPQDRTVRLENLRLVDAEARRSFQFAALNVNLVLRWEYRLGSTLFLVYSRAQESLPWPEELQPSTGRLRSDLTGGPARDSFLLKWSYWWDA